MLNQYKVKKNYSDIEPHEVLLDKMAYLKEDELGLSEKKFEVPLKEKISYFLFLIFFILASALFAKIFYFQFFEGDKLFVQAENNKGAASLIVPQRGIIYDRNMEKLVINSPAFDLVCSRSGFSFSASGFPSPETTAKISKIAEILGLDELGISDNIKKTESSEVLVSGKIDHEQLLLLEINMASLPGCQVRENTARRYVSGSIFSQVLGYTGRINKDEYSSSTGYAINDYIGKTGLEKYYEVYLRGVVGQSKSSKTVRGAVVEEEILKKPVAGNNLVLNIDASLQAKIYESLEKSIKNSNAQKGAAIAMDPRTGAVLALVSYPSYDNNLFSRGISQEEYNVLLNDSAQPFFNRAIAAKYPTGSTIKPFEAAAVLQEKIISPEKKIYDPGFITVQSRNDPNVTYRYGGVTPHGWVDMREAIAVSSNIYFYTVGGGHDGQEGLGPARIKKYLSYFGWDQKTGIDLPGEFTGFIPDPNWKKQNIGQPWWDGDTYNLSIGQSYLQVTPLHVAAAYVAIANGGTLYKPQIVNKIIAGTGDRAEVIEEFEPVVLRQNFIDPENLQIVREGMRQAVTMDGGSGQSLVNLPVPVAVKTGTAEIGYEDHFNVWSSVFAPYENPEIVLVITVENVKGFGAVTLPVANEVLSWYFKK